MQPIKSVGNDNTIEKEAGWVLLDMDAAAAAAAAAASAAATAAAIKTVAQPKHGSTEAFRMDDDSMARIMKQVMDELDAEDKKNNHKNVEGSRNAHPFGYDKWVSIQEAKQEDLEAQNTNGPSNFKK